MWIFDYWKRLSVGKKRIWTIVFCFLLSIIVTIAGVLTPLSREEADIISDELNQTRENIYRMTYVQQAATIFGNNLLICLTTFVPIAGPIFGLYVLYSTGVVIAADSIAYGLPPLTVFLYLIVLPFAWMEFLAYSIAFAASVWLTWCIIQRKGRSEIVKTCIFISICAIILLAAAIIEVAIIASVPSTQ